MRLVATLIVLLATGACSTGGVDIIAREDLPPEIYGGAGARRENNLVLYMVEGNRLVRVSRTGTATGSVAEVALRELLAGPTTEELDRRIETRLPEDLELHGVNVVNDVARVDVGRQFLVVRDPNDPHEYLLRVAQIVWTLDELPDVNSVQFLIDGQLSAVLDQEEDVVRTPVARQRYQRFEPRQDRPVSQAPLQIDI
jgi:hypothetical protein